LGRRSSYAEDIRAAAQRKGIGTISQLAHACGYSYEQVRKLWVGECSLSRKLNDRLCKLLDLDAERMWSIAVDDKFQRKHHRPAPPIDHTEAALLTIWSRMPRSRQRLAIGVLRLLADSDFEEDVHE